MKKYLAVLIIVSVVCPLSAMAGTARHSSVTAYGEPGNPKQIDRMIMLEAKDYAFDQKAIHVRRGETIKFTVKNIGEQEHELTIGDQAMQLEHRKMMAEMPGMDHSKMAGHTMHHNNVSLKPGETKSLVWRFSKAGAFAFACNFPGHAELGMDGTIIVE